MSEFFLQYGLFLLKTVTIVIAIVIVIVFAAAAGRKGGGEGLEVENLNKKFRDVASALKKAILKKAMRPRIPDVAIDRPKKGFGIPVAAWLKGPLNPMVDDLLSESRLRDAGYLNPLVVRRLIDEHRSNQANHRKVLWTLLSFELWREARGISGRA